MASAAVFWDRDNTLIKDPGYISDPDQVELLPGAAEAIRRLAEAGFENIIVTNQSGIARGLLDEPTLEKIHDRLRQLLAGAGAKLDAIYYCPYLPGPEAVVEAYRQDSDLRKPKAGMLVKASLERKVDMAGAWMIGDAVHDAQAGRAAGCRTILIRVDRRGDVEVPKSSDIDFVAGSVTEAADIVLKHTRSAQPSKSTTPSDDTATILREILNFLKMADRRAQREDFSLARLAGAIVQILALGAMLWAIFAMIRGEEYGVQIIRLLFGLLLQLIAMTFFVLIPKK